MAAPTGEARVIRITGDLVDDTTAYGVLRTLLRLWRLTIGSVWTGDRDPRAGLIKLLTSKALSAVGALFTLCGFKSTSADDLFNFYFFETT